jgi:hypothetical protein
MCSLCANTSLRKGTLLFHEEVVHIELFLALKIQNGAVGKSRGSGGRLSGVQTLALLLLKKPPETQCISAGVAFGS